MDRDPQFDKIRNLPAFQKAGTAGEDLLRRFRQQPRPLREKVTDFLSQLLVTTVLVPTPALS